MVITNEFEREVIVLNTTTLVRLFNISPDATLLYLFYVKNAKIQGTNSVYATDAFCRKGLKWGRDRFNAAKTILKDEEFISIKILRDDEGKIIKHFIRIHYLSSRVPETHCVDEPTCGFQTTNAVNKKINAIDENINTIVTEWNNTNLQKCKVVNKTIINLIKKALNLFSLSDLTQAIRNYSEIVSSDDYWFSYKWNISNFFSRGLSIQGQNKNGGFLQFLDKENPLDRFRSQSFTDEFAKIRYTIPLQTLKYDPRSPLDVDRQTYMGVSLNIIQSRNFREYLIDFRNRSDIQFPQYLWIEEGIAGALYHKDKQLLYEYIAEFRRYVKVFKKQSELYKKSF